MLSLAFDTKSLEVQRSVVIEEFKTTLSEPTLMVMFGCYCAL